MRKRLTVLALLMSVIITPFTFAMCQNNDEIIIEKYQVLAKIYETFARDYELIVDAQVNQEIADTQEAQGKFQAASEGDVPKSSNLVNIKSSLNSLNFSVVIINGDAVLEEKPKIGIVEPWKGTSVSFGGGIVTGNSAAINYNSSANISYNPIIPWQNTLIMSYLYNRDDVANGKGVKMNKFQVKIKSSWNFNKNNGVYSQINYLNNQLDTYTYILSESVGYQRKLYSSDSMSFDTTIGRSLTQQKIKEIGKSSNALGAQVGLDYLWNFTKMSSFKQSFLVNWAANNATTYQANSTLVTEMYRNLTLQLGFQINGSSWASLDKKRVNTVMSTKIAYVC